MSKPTPDRSALDCMLLADGELPAGEAAPRGPDADATVASIQELGELVRGSLELAADDAEPRLAGLWDLVERRLDLPAAPAPAPAAARPLWSRVWTWLAGHRSHMVTGLVSAGAVGALALALRPAPEVRTIERTVAVPAVTPTAVLARTPPEVESIDVGDGTGSVFTIDDEDGETAVLWIEPAEYDPTEGI
ncbi:MAG: hypothetical protein R3B06_05615 [Kofleriaceae bacterium]